LPPSLRDQLSPGTIFLAEWRFAGGTVKKKFFVVMHVDTKNDRILAFVTTSQLQFFKDNPRLECEIVRVEPGLFRPFTKETAIDCRNAHSMQIGKLDQLRADGKLEVKGRLPSPVMRKVFDTVRASRLLSRKLKRLLAP
jgi:hypothetical protein